MMEEQEPPAGPVPFQTPLQPGGTPFIDRHGIPPVLFIFLSLVVILVLYQGIPVVITLIVFGLNLDGGTKLITPQNVNQWRWFTGLSQIVLLLAPTLLLARLVSPRLPNFFRLRLPKFTMFLLPLLGILCLQQMLQIYLIFQDKIPLPEQLERFNRQFKDAYEEVARMLTGSATVPELLWVVLIVALIPAFAEEFLFRGLVQRSLQKTITPWRAALVTGMIFGAYHLNPASLIPLAVLGIYLGFLAMRADSIWVSVAAHFYNNAAACIAVFFHQNEDAIITGNPNEMSVPELLGSFSLFGIVFLLSTYHFFKATKPGVENEVHIHDGESYSYGREEE